MRFIGSVETINTTLRLLNIIYMQLKELVPPIQKKKKIEEELVPSLLEDFFFFFPRGKK